MNNYTKITLAMVRKF
ncbi:Protein of unknown function [Bacillus mycoides]|nr:Protein of unknown function [Bacillus mycoides]